MIIFIDHNLWKLLERDIDQDSNLKICLQPGLGVQKVEKHCFRRCVYSIEQENMQFLFPPHSRFNNIGIAWVYVSRQIVITLELLTTIFFLN
jgi:hypothetical protein